MLWDKESGLNYLVKPRTGEDKLGGVGFLQKHEDTYCCWTRDWEY